MAGEILAPMGNSGAKVRQFFDRPEGKLGIIGIVLLSAAAIWVGLDVLPWIEKALQNWITTTLMAVAFIIVMYIVFNKKTWTALSAIYQVAMYHIMNFIITLDPIALMKELILKLEKKLVSVRDNIDKLNGMIKQLQDDLAKNKENYEKDFKAMAVLKGKEDFESKLLFTEKSRNTGRISSETKTYLDMLRKFQTLYNALTKVEKVCESTIRDTNKEIEHLEKQLKYYKAASNAVKSAQSILYGDPDDRALYLQAMEITKDQMYEKMGRIDRFIETSSKFVNGMDLDNKIFEAEALSVLDEYEKTGYTNIVMDIEQIAKGPDFNAVMAELKENSKSHEPGKQQDLITPQGKGSTDANPYGSLLK